MRALRKFCSKKTLLGCLAQMTHLPMARASAEVVATTSLVLGFTKTLHGYKRRSFVVIACMRTSVGQTDKRGYCQDWDYHHSIFAVCIWSWRTHHQSCKRHPSPWAETAENTSLKLLVKLSVSGTAHRRMLKEIESTDSWPSSDLYIYGVYSQLWSLSELSHKLVRLTLLICWQQG